MPYLLYGYIRGATEDRVDKLEIIMKKISDRCNFTVKNKSFTAFEPYGGSGVLTLAESHFITTHTYLEDDLIYIDVFCCASNFNPELCSQIIEEEFNATSGHWTAVDRTPHVSQDI